MQSVLIVGLGGFLGSALRYGLGRIPLIMGFPLITMLINILGSFIIGATMEFSKNNALINSNMTLFLQTGFCGGFTTFSAFSLETVILFQNNKYLIGSSYIVLTVVLCLISTVLGMILVRLIHLKMF